MGSATPSSGTEGTIADPSDSTTDEMGTDTTTAPVDPGESPAQLDHVRGDTTDGVTDPPTEPVPETAVTLEANTDGAVVPEPVAVVPEPVAVVPEPVAVVPEPVAVVPEPVAVEPDRAASADQDAGTTSTDGGSGDAVHPPPPPLPPPDEPVSTRRGRRGLVAILTVLSLVVVGAGIGGVIWSRSGKKKAAAPPATQPPTSPTLPDGSFVTFKDSEAGFTIRYPRGWARSQPPVAEIRLWASDGKQFAASVRVIHTEEVTTPANLANLKAVTDGVVGPGVQILKQDPITVNGLIGYRYIYTLTDKDSGLTAAHLHYFLFQGHKMNSIVFEAVPSETFSRIEGVFDQMLGSFHSDPEPS